MESIFILLLNEEKGIPDFYLTLQVIIKLRNQPTVKTIRNKHEIIQKSKNNYKQNLTIDYLKK